MDNTTGQDFPTQGSACKFLMLVFLFLFSSLPMIEKHMSAMCKQLYQIFSDLFEQPSKKYGPVIAIRPTSWRNTYSTSSYKYQLEPVTV